MKTDCTLRTRREFLRSSVLGGAVAWSVPAFLANTFAPTDKMLPWLRTIAEWNPISALVQSLRELWGNTPPAPADASWSLHHPVLMTVVWSVGLTLVLMPLALRAFQRRTQD